MSRETYPDYLGFWVSDNSEGVFYLWFNPPEKGNIIATSGAILDRFGVATFEKWRTSRNSEKLRFEKRYIPSASAGALNGKIVYIGNQINLTYRGEYVRGKRNGFFFIQQYPKNSPTLDCIVREECRRAIRNFGRDLGERRDVSCNEESRLEEFPALKFINELAS